MNSLEFAHMTTGNFIGQTSATDLSPKRRICRSMRWICWAKTCRKKAMPCANLHICAKNSALVRFFAAFSQLFWDFSTNFCEYSQQFEAFLQKKRSVARFCASSWQKKLAQSRARCKYLPRRHATVHSHQHVVALRHVVASAPCRRGCAFEQLV